MILDILDYSTSPLNPLLKYIIFGVFAVVVLIFYKAKGWYGGRFRRVLDLLTWSFAFLAIGALLRSQGHGTDYGFTKELSLKWFQSIFIVLGAALFAYTAKLLAGFRKEFEEN